MGSEALRELFNWLRAIIVGEATLNDFLAMVLRQLWLQYSMRYNFYIKKKKFIDRRKGSGVTVIVLLGRYSSLWNVVFERLYAYMHDYDILLANAGGFYSEKAISLSKKYGFSYFEAYPNNYVAAQNYAVRYLTSSRFIMKIDDDIFVTKYTRNIVDVYKRLLAEGYDVGFVAPVLNVNNVSYYYFLKTLNLLEEYEKMFEKPIFIKMCSKLKIWYDPGAAKWIWEKSLPLNTIAEIFYKRNYGMVEAIPVRFSIGLILFERKFLLENSGYMSPGPKLSMKKLSATVKPPPIPIEDEGSINSYANNAMYGRFLALEAFAGHLSYHPQSSFMLKWFEDNKRKLLEDL